MTALAKSPPAGLLLADYHINGLFDEMFGEEPNLKYILENLEKLVIKAANESGSYGILMRPKATKSEIED